MRHLACLALTVFVIGCSGPQQSDAASPPVAAIAVGEIELSNAFWEENSDFVRTNYHFASLAEITAGAHLVIRGLVVGTQDGKLQSFDRPGSFRKTTFGIVAVDEVLNGTPEMQVPGCVLVARLGEAEQPADKIPSGEILLFLNHYPTVRAQLGVDPSIDPDDRFFYGRPNGYQSVLRNLGGVVRIVDGPEGWENALGPFPAPLDGEPFADVLETIRRLVADQ